MGTRGRQIQLSSPKQRLCQQQAGRLYQCTGRVAADRADKVAELDAYAECSLPYSGAIGVRAHVPRVGATVRWPMLPPYG